MICRLIGNPANPLKLRCFVAFRDALVDPQIEIVDLGVGGSRPPGCTTFPP